MELTLADGASEPTSVSTCGFNDALIGFQRALAGLPWFHSRRLGLLLMQLGSIITLATLPFSIAAMNIGFAGALVGALLARPPIHLFPGFKIGVAFAAWVMVSLIVNSSQHGALAFNHFSLAYKWLALPIGAAAFSTRAARCAAICALCIGTFLISLLAIMQFLGGYDGDAGHFHIKIDPKLRFERVSGTLGGVLTYGLATTMIAVLVLTKPATELAPRWLLFLGRFGAVVGAVLSCSRMAMVGATTATGSYLMAKDRKNLWRAIISMAVLVAIGTAALYLIAPKKLERLSAGEDQRLRIWTTSVKLAAQHPLFGVGGREAFEVEYAKLDQALQPEEDARSSLRAQHAHNNELVLATQYGIPSVLLHIAFLIALALALFRDRQASPSSFRVGLALLGGWFVAGQFNNLVGQAEGAFALYLPLAVAWSFSSRAESGTPPWSGWSRVAAFGNALVAPFRELPPSAPLPARSRWEKTLPLGGVDALTVIEYGLTACFLLLFPFYLFKTSLPTPGHWAAGALALVVMTIRREPLTSYQRSFMYPLFAFTGWTLAVGITWAIILNHTKDTLTAPLLYNAGALLVYALVVLTNRHGYRFVKFLFWFAAASVLCQFILALSLAEGNYRNSLFFDNPNQLGLFALASGLIVILLAHRFPSGKRLVATLAFALSVALVGISLSRAAMVSSACAIVLVMLLLSKRGLLAYAALFACGVLLLMLFSDHHLVSNAWTRWSRTGVSRYDTFFGRGYDRMLNHPWFLVLGSGEGVYTRFKSHLLREMHSTLGTILFSYGVAGLSLFGFFLYRLAKPHWRRSAFALLPLMAYGLTHHALRSIYVWLLFAVLAIAQEAKLKDEADDASMAPAALPTEPC